MAGLRKVGCPLCGEFFELEPGLGIGETTTCPDCYATLTVIGLDPPEVEEAGGVFDEYSEEGDNGGP